MPIQLLFSLIFYFHRLVFRVRKDLCLGLEQIWAGLLHAPIPLSLRALIYSFACWYLENRNLFRSRCVKRSTFKMCLNIHGDSQSQPGSIFQTFMLVWIWGDEGLLSISPWWTCNPRPRYGFSIYSIMFEFELLWKRCRQSLMCLPVQLGLGDSNNRDLPVQVTMNDGRRAASVACGWWHTLASVHIKWFWRQQGRGFFSCNVASFLYMIFLSGLRGVGAFFCIGWLRQPVFLFPK